MGAFTNNARSYCNHSHPAEIRALSCGNAANLARSRASLRPERATRSPTASRVLERIVVGPEEIIVEAKAAEVIAMMAKSGSMAITALSEADKRPTNESTADAVHTYVPGWHATWVPRMNVRSTLVVDLGKERKHRQSERLALPRVSHLLATAVQWQGQLDRGEVRNRAEIARREGLSQVYVGHLLRLLGLHPDIRAAIAALPAGTSPRMITERRLRPIARMSWKRQLAKMDWLLKLENRPEGNRKFNKEPIDFPFANRNALKPVTKAQCIGIRGRFSS